MLRKVLFTAALAVSIMAGHVNAEDITVHGSTTVEANLFLPHKEKLEEMTGLNLTVVGNGSSRGIKGIDEDLSHIGMISSNLDNVLAKLEMSDRKDEFIAERVGETIATYAVHPSNSVKSLTQEQVQGILLGDITNWSEVGGDDKPIMVVTEYEGGGIRSTIEKKVLSKKSITDKARAMPNGSQIVNLATQVPHVFATVTTKHLEGTDGLVKLESEADVVQPLVLVVKDERTPAFDKLVKASKKLLN